MNTFAPWRPEYISPRTVLASLQQASVLYVLPYVLLKVPPMSTQSSISVPALCIISEARKAALFMSRVCADDRIAGSKRIISPSSSILRSFDILSLIINSFLRLTFTPQKTLTIPRVFLTNAITVSSPHFCATEQKRTASSIGVATTELLPESPSAGVSVWRFSGLYPSRFAHIMFLLLIFCIILPHIAVALIQSVHLSAFFISFAISQTTLESESTNEATVSGWQSIPANSSAPSTFNAVLNS